jgi:hypothetical protein
MASSSSERTSGVVLSVSLQALEHSDRQGRLGDRSNPPSIAQLKTGLSMTAGSVAEKRIKPSDEEVTPVSGLHTTRRDSRSVSH